MKQKILYGCSALAVSLVLLLSLTAIGRSAVTELSGLAVAQTGTLWKNVKDASVGDNMVDGILSSGMIFYDSVGGNFDRLRGTIANGILADITRLPGSNQTPADDFTNPTTFLGTWSLSGIFDGTTWDRWRGQVTPVQGITLLNASVTGSADSVLTITLTGVASTRIHFYKVIARCSPAGNSSFSITDGATSLGGMFVPSAPLQISEEWSTGLTMTTGNNGIITMQTCGAGNTGIVSYQADQF